MRYISLSEVLELHRRIIEESGGSTGLRDLGGLDSAIAQPRIRYTVIGASKIYFQAR